MEKAIVHLWELPENQVIIELESQVREEIFRVLKTRIGSLRSISRLLKVDYHYLCDLARGRRGLPLSIVSRALTLLKRLKISIPKALVEKNVISIRVKYGRKILNPHLPFNFNFYYGGIVIGSCLFDGGIRSSSLQPFYTNRSFMLREKVYHAYTKVFGEILSRACTPDKETMQFPKIAGLVLVQGLKLKAGDKLLNNPNIPDFLFSAKETTKVGFLQQAFDDEASIKKYSIVNLKDSPTIKLSLSSPAFSRPELLLAIKKLLESLGIYVIGPYPDKSYTKGEKQIVVWCIKIVGKLDVILFHNKIGFEQPFKRKRMNQVIKLIKKRKHVPYTTKFALEYYLAHSYLLEKEIGVITSRLLANRTKRNIITLQRWLIKLFREGFLTREMEAPFKYIYTLTEEGKNAAMQALCNPIVQAYVKLDL